MRKYIFIILFGGIATVASGQSDSLNRYLDIACRNNPAVQATFFAYEASLQKVPQAGAFEDPRLDMGFFLQPMELVEGREIAQFQLMQMFPWFGTRKAARTEAQHMAKMAFEEFREARDNLYLDVYTQWYVLCRLQQRLVNSRENIQLLKQVEELALRKFSSGGSVSGSYPSPVKSMAADNPASTGGGSGMSGMGMGGAKTSQPQPTANAMASMGSQATTGMSSSSGGMSDVLRIQLETAELENSVESIQSEIIAEKARFNALLNRPAGSEVTIPGEMVQIPYLHTMESVVQLIAGQNPVLEMLREESLAYEAKMEMVRKMGYPMFGIGLQYMLIGKTPESNPGMTAMENPGAMNNPGTMNTMNGKDMIMPMVSVSIPVFRGKYKAARRETRLQQQATQARYNDAQNRLEAELYRSKHLLDDAARKITLYQKQAELARTTYGLVVQEFVSNKSDLSSVIQVQRQLLDYGLKESDAIADYNTMVANIQKLISKSE